MWTRLTGKSEGGSSAKKEDDEGRRKRSSTTTSRSKRDRDRDRDDDPRSVVSSTSTRRPSTRNRRDSPPSTIASFTTAFDRAPSNNDDLYEDPRRSTYTESSVPTMCDSRPSSYAESSVPSTMRDSHRSSYAESSVPTTRDSRRSSYTESSAPTIRDSKERRREKRSSKDSKSEKRKSTRSERSSTAPSQAGGYRGSIVDEPRPLSYTDRSFSDQIGGEGFSPFPGQVGAPMMSGALPAGSTPHSQYPVSPIMSSHVHDQFPGQDPVQYASSAMPGNNPFGAAADFYNDQGQSVDMQPGVRPQPPSVIIGQDTPHLMAAAAQANPIADTGSGSAADFYGTNAPVSTSKPPRPNSMPGAFVDEGPLPSSTKPSKTNTFPTTAAGMAGGAALGYAMGHSSSNAHHSTSYNTSNMHHSTSYNEAYNSNAPAGHSGSSPLYHQGDLPSTAAINGSYSNLHDTQSGAPPPKPPRPGKPEKQSSSSNAGLYTAGAAGLAAYALHNHNSHSSAEHAHHTHTHTHNHTHSMPGAFPGQGSGGVAPSPSPYMSGGMAHQHQHVGPVSKFVDWWKDHEDVQKMEEYTEYIGVCKYCFDPRSSPMDAPRKHHYYDRRRRSDEYDRPSGGIDKKSRYGLKEKTSRTSLYSSGDDKRKKSSSNAGWLAASLGGIGLATAGKALFTSGRDDFDDTYSIKSGRENHSRHSRRSRSRESVHSKRYSYGSAGIRHRSRSQDRTSFMSQGITKDRKDHKVVRRHGSRSSSSSNSRSRDRKSGLGTAIGAGLAGIALGAATKGKGKDRSRSRSAHKVQVRHRRNSSSEEERRRRRSQQLRKKSSRSSVSGASFIDISQDQQSQGGFLGGFFTAPPPKEKRHKRSDSNHIKKKKGFFNFGNGSSSSSESDMAFGTGFVRRTKKKRSTHNLKKQSSDERLKATLAGLGATAAAIAVAKAARRNGGKSDAEVVAVKERRSRRDDRRRPGAASQYGDDEWEDLPDDGTSSSASDADLLYGDHALRKTQSRESLNSNGSGTNKWGWRWGFGKKKRRSSDNLYNNIASTSLVRPAAAGAIGATAAGAAASRLSRPGSESSSQHTLQSVYPVASTDPTTFDARRTSTVSTSTPQALVTTGPGAIGIHQPQPIHQVPGSIYTTEAQPQHGYTAPVGPPVFSQHPPYPYQAQAQAQNIIINNHQYPPPPALRRANSSPIQKSSWKKEVAIAGLAATAGAAAIVAAKGSDSDRPSSAQSNVRFNLTKKQAAKDARERRREQDRKDEEDARRRAQEQKDDELRRDEAERRRREDEQRRDEDDRRQREVQRQQDEARKYMEAERLARIETDRLEAERRRLHEEMVARETQEAEDRDRRERDARAEAQRRNALEREEEQRRKERREADAIEAERREAQIRSDLDRQRRNQDLYDSDRDQRRLEYQPTGSSVTSVATDVRRKEQELQDRERDLVKPDSWKSTAAGAVAAGAVAAITAEAISSHKDKKSKEREQRRENWRDTSSSEKEVAPSYQAYKPSQAVEVKPSSVKTYEPSFTEIKPSQLNQDYVDEEIFDPTIFKKKQTTDDVFNDWQDRYTAEPVSQADFFAPKELLADDTLPKVRSVDPNEGAPDLHVYESIEDYGASQPKGPPYPPSYSFTATRDGRGPRTPDPVPTLNLIQPTPPGSRAPSIRSVSMPPSPNIEPVKEEEGPRPKNAPSRVSWGENKFHHFDVPTPESYKEGFISDRDLEEHDKKHSQDEVVVERDSPKSGPKTTTYQPFKPSALSKSSEPKEIAPSTQYVPDKKDDSSWDTTEGAMSRKASKREKKAKKAAAAAVAAGAAGALTAAAIAQNDRDDDPTDWDYKLADNRSSISNPFSDSNAARSTIAPSAVSSIPSMGESYKSPSPYDYITESEVGSSAYGKDTASDKRDSAAPSELHMPGEFVEEPTVGKSTEPAKKIVEEDEWAAPSSKKSKKGKRKSKSTDEEVVTHDIPRQAKLEAARTPEIPQEEGLRVLSKKEQAKREKDAKRMSMMSVQSWEMSDDSRPSSPTYERDPRDLEPSYDTQSSKYIPSASEISSFVWGASDDTQSAASVSTVIPYTRTPPAPQEEKRRQIPDEGPVNVKWDSPSVDAPMHSGPTSSRDAPRYGESSSTSRATTAALAGGFAALMGASAKQDTDRIAAEREHARQALEAASKHAPRQEGPISPPNGTRSRDDSNKAITIPSYAFEGVDEPSEVKTPRRKLEKRHSSGKWSPTVSSPLRAEMKYEDYLGRSVRSGSPEQTHGTTTQYTPVSPPEPYTSHNRIQDSGYYAPDDRQRKESIERDSDEFFSAGSEEREREKSEKAREQLIENYNAHQNKARSDYDETSTYVTAFSRPDVDDERARTDLIDKYNAYEPSAYSQHDQDDASTFVSAFSRPDDDSSTIVASKNKHRNNDDDVPSTVSSRNKYDDDPDREERRRRRREARAAQSGSRSQSRDRGYSLDDSSERKRRHRRKEADESGYISDTKSTVSEARSEGDRRRKHRKSKRDDEFDDGASMVSTSSKRDEEKGSKRKEEKEKEKEKEKRSSGLFGLFSSKSKENVAEPSKSSSSKSKSRDVDEDDEDRKQRRRKHRSSTYGSDDDDAKSTVSSGSRTHRSEKRSSRSERGDDRDRRDRDDEKVHRSSLR